LDTGGMLAVLVQLQLVSRKGLTVKLKRYYLYVLLTSFLYKKLLAWFFQANNLNSLKNNMLSFIQVGALLVLSAVSGLLAYRLAISLYV
jgi:hypothetical protein